MRFFDSAKSKENRVLKTINLINPEVIGIETENAPLSRLIQDEEATLIFIKTISILFFFLR